MSEHETPTNIQAFLARLAALDTGDRARLKRNAGKTMNEADKAVALFYRLLPYGVPVFQEPTYFLVATLYPLIDGGGAGNLGDALARVRQRQPEMAKGLDRRVERLLDSDEEQLAFRLRQTIHFLQSARQPIHWPTLLEDLLTWNHPERYVQKRWARSYYGQLAAEPTPVTATPEPS